MHSGRRNGALVDGDKMLYIFAKRLSERGMLDGGKVVTTVMSNSGLLRSLDAIGIGYEQTDVGDRFVFECMEKNGYRLGGEQSGHIILRKYASTGDGILTALMIAEEMRDKKLPLSGLCEGVTLFPQRTKNNVQTPILILSIGVFSLYHDEFFAAAILKITEERYIINRK